VTAIKIPPADKPEVNSTAVDSTESVDNSTPNGCLDTDNDAQGAFSLASSSALLPFYFSSVLT